MVGNELLESRIVPATFVAGGLGDLALSTLYANETVEMSFVDETHVQFTLGSSNEDTWTGIDDPAAGYWGNGSQTLTVDTSVFSIPTVTSTPLISITGIDTAVTVVGAGEDQPFPFDTYLLLSGTRGSVHFTGETASFSGRLDMNISHRGHHVYDETADGIQRVDFDVPVIVHGAVSLQAAGHLQFDQPFTVVGGDENVWDGADSHISLVSIVAEEISVNAPVRTLDADGPGGRSVTASIQMLSLNNIYLNAEVSTGNVLSATNDPFYGIVSSGEIALRAGGDPSTSTQTNGSVIGNDNGIIRTGSVHHLEGGASYSGSINIESVLGRIELPATDAIITGDAVTSPSNGQNQATVSGDIRFFAGSGISSDNADGRLSVLTGIAMSSTGAGFDNAGYGQLYLNHNWSLPANGDIHVTSSRDLRVQSIYTDPDHSNIVEIESTSGLLLVKLFPFFGDDFIGLSGDQVSFLSSSSGGMIEFLEAVPGLGVDFGNGSLTLVSDGFYSRPWIGSDPEIVPGILAGTGTLQIRSFTNEGMSLGAADSDTQTADVVFNAVWMDLFRPGWSEVILGDAADVPVITINADFHSENSLTLLAREIRGPGLLSTDGNLRLLSSQAAIGTQEEPVHVSVSGRLDVETQGPGGPAGDIFISSSSPLTIGSLATGPDPDVVQISTSSGDIIFENSVLLNDDITITSAGSVVLSASGTLETGSWQIEAQSNIYGPGMLSSTNPNGIQLTSLTGGLGDSGNPLNIMSQNGGHLSTLSTLNQYLWAPDQVTIHQLDAGLGQIQLFNGQFQLSSDDGISDLSDLHVLSGSSLNLAGHQEQTGGLSILGGSVESGGGSIISLSGQVFVTTGNASGLSGSQDIFKSDSGVFTFNGDNLTTGQVLVASGTVIIAPDANLTNSNMVISADAIATSTAATSTITAGTVHISPAGLLTAGNSPGQFGMRQLTSHPGGRLLIELSGEVPGVSHDQIVVSESADISNVELELLLADFSPTEGSEFRILDNQGALPIAGTFAGLPEGTIFTVSGVELRITYVGGDGNDIVVSEYTPAGPSDIILDHSTILENQPANTLVGLLSTVEEESAVSHTFELIAGDGDTDNSRFTIVNGNELRATEAFDFESLASLNIRVRSTGSNGFTFEKSFVITVENVTELVGIDVQLGQNQRSYVRYLDTIFDRPEEVSNLLSAEQLQLYRFDLNGLNPQLVPLPAYSISAATVRFDFGAQGIGGNRNSNIGDGYYQLVLHAETRSFHRLLGDITGDGTVDAADKSQVLFANRSTNPESDANGDGVVNLTDVSLVSRAYGRKLKDDLFTDD